MPKNFTWYFFFFRNKREAPVSQPQNIILRVPQVANCVTGKTFFWRSGGYERHFLRKRALHEEEFWRSSTFLLGWQHCKKYGISGQCVIQLVSQIANCVKRNAFSKMPGNGDERHPTRKRAMKKQCCRSQASRCVPLPLHKVFTDLKMVSEHLRCPSDISIERLKFLWERFMRLASTFGSSWMEGRGGGVPSNKYTSVRIHTCITSELHTLSTDRAHRDSTLFCKTKKLP